MIVSCSVRWNRIAFSIAIAHGSTSVSTSSRSVLLNEPPRLFRISSTPIVRPRETSGAHRIERVSNEVLASTWGAKRGSRLTSLTIAGLPVSATQPATPSPILGLSAATSRPFAPSAASKTSSCFSSSTISSDQASEGISWRIFSTTSSITLRGSRIELAVFTTSVRIASRRAEVCVARGRPPPRRSPARRPPRRCASTASGGGSALPQASTTKSSPSRAMLAQRALVRPDREPSQRAPGQRPARRRDLARRGALRDGQERRGEARALEPTRAGRAPRRTRTRARPSA